MSLTNRKLTLGLTVALVFVGLAAPVDPPTLLNLTPNTAQQGQQNLQIAIIGQLTHFTQSISIADFGTGITVTKLTVNSPTTATATINIDPNSPIRSQTVNVGTGAESVSLIRGFTINAGTPTLLSVSPNSAPQGQKGVVVKIGAQFTHFVQGATTASFGPGITVTSLTINSPSSATAVLDLDGGAGIGNRLLTMTTGAELVTLPRAFLITSTNGYCPITQIPPGPRYILDDFNRPDGPVENGWSTWWNGLLNDSRISLLNGRLLTHGAPNQGGAIYRNLPVSFPLAFGFDFTSSIAIKDNQCTVGTPYTNEAGWSISFNVPPTAGSPITAPAQIRFFQTAGSRNIYRALWDGSQINIDPTPGLPEPEEIDRLKRAGQRDYLPGSTAKIRGLINADLSATILIDYNDGLQPNTVAVCFGQPYGAVAPALGSMVVLGTSSCNTGALTFDNFELHAMEGTVSPSLLNVVPNTTTQGQQNVSVAITGQFTHFVQGTTTANFGAGITTKSLTVNSATSASAIVSVDAAATVGLRNVTLITGSESVTLSSGFTVSPGTPVLLTVAPNSGFQGQQGLNVLVTGQYTRFAPGATVNFGSGIIATITTATATTANALVSIGTTAALGPRSVTVTSGTEVVTLTNGFTVIPSPNQAPVVSAGPDQTVPLDYSPVRITDFPVNRTNAVYQQAGLVTGPDGNIWFIEGSGEKIAKMNTAGLILGEYPIPSQGPNGSGTGALALGSDGNIWFAEYFTHKIGRITPSGVITEFPIPGRFPGSITSGPDGNLWFTEYLSNVIGRITTSGIITEFPVPSAGVYGASIITAGPDGNLWFTVSRISPGASGPQTIGKITPAGVITEYPVTAGSGPHGITTGLDGNLWFTEFFGNKVGRITTSGVITEFPINGSNLLYFIKSGPDGNLWVTDQSTDHIFRVSTVGAVTAFSLSKVDVQGEIIIGPDGNLWFVKATANALSRIELGVFPTAANPALTGSIVDDGLPANATLSTTWSLTTGPAPVAFSKPTSIFPDIAGQSNPVTTSALFTASGTYKVALTGSDSSLSSTATTTVTVIPPQAPVLASITPNSGLQGQQNLSVAIGGQFTQFAQGTTIAYFGEGIGVVSLTVTSATTASAILTIGSNAAPGSRRVSMTTGTEAATLADGFTVVKNDTPPPSISTILPTFGRPGEVKLIAVTGLNTNFVQGTTKVDFGAGISVGIVTVSNPNALTVQISISASAAVGPHDVTITTGSEILSLSNGFAVQPATLVNQAPFVSAGPNQNVNLLSAPLAFTAFQVPSGGSNTYAIANGPDGNRWFTESDTNKIGRITPSGVITEFPVPTSGAKPSDITSGPDGNLWFTEYRGNKIGRITPTGSITEFPIPTNGSLPYGITTGPDGALWFTESSENGQIHANIGGKIGRITVNGMITEYPLPTGGTIPAQITTGPDGNLWFAEGGANNIGRITPTGVITEFPMSPTFGNAFGIATGPDGNLWFGSYFRSSIGKMTTTGNFTEFPVVTDTNQLGINGLAFGPDGNLWFPQNGRAVIGRITSTGAVTEYPVPTLGGLGLAEIVLGPDCNLWMTDQAGFIIKFSPGVLPIAATLNGSILDDGLPNGSSLSTNWNLAGKGACSSSVATASATFPNVSGQSNPVTTAATFQSVGNYTAILTGSDSLLSNSANASINVTAPTQPVLTVLPAVGQQGQQQLISIAGQLTNFVQGTTKVTFGAGVTIGAVTVTSPTTLSVQVTIGSTALFGPRTVSVVTGSEVAASANAFTVAAGAPILTSLVPNTGRLGQTLTVTMTGLFTRFTQGTTTVSFGAGITVSNVNVSSATSLTAQLAVDAAATIGTRTPVVTTGAEIVSVNNIFNVVAPVPILSILNPGGGQQGLTNYAVQITGQSTQFVQGVSVASFGAGISVVSLTVTSPVVATAVITIDPAATTGTRTVSVTTGFEIASFTNGFTVSAGSPSIILVSPNTAQPGQTLTTAVTGLSTHFVQGTTTANLGAGVTVNSVTVTSPVTATLSIKLDAAASFGLRDVTLTTGGEVAKLPGGFAVNPGATITQMNPANGQQGQPTFAVSIIGVNTRFVQGSTQANFGEGIGVGGATAATFGPVTVNSPTSATAQVTIAPSAGIGLRTVSIQTGTESTSAPNSFQVLQSGAVISAVAPKSGVQGQTVSVVVTGQSTRFAQGTTQVSFGQGILVNSVTVASPTSLTAQLSIAGNAAPGLRDVIATTGTEQATLAGGFTVQSSANQSPVITISPTWSVILPSRLTLTYSVTDDGLPLGGALTVSWEVVSGPGNFGFQNQDFTSISVGFDLAGTYVLRITATDTQFTVTKDVTVTVTGTAAPAPTVSLATPVEGQEITTLTDVVGTVNSSAIASWTLEYRPPESSNYQTLATGTTNIANAKLGTFDPTLMLNGIAYIRLKATDAFGQTTIGPEISLVLTKNQKIGNFTVSFKDLEVPLAGIGIQIIRTYDSRNLTKSDFGVGWTLDIRNVRLRDNGEMGLSWQGTKTGTGFSTNYCIVATKQHVVTVILSDGTTYKFQPTLTPACQQLVPIDQVAIGFQQVSGPTATLTLIGTNLAFVQASWPGPLRLIDDSAQPIDFDNYILTLSDGRKLNISRAFGLQTLTDLNQNKITITNSGITHTSGQSITFVRDVNNRITRITDPNGKNLDYVYDVRGDLATFTDGALNTSTYTYDTNHRLTKIKDPRGIEPIRNDYDSSGRLIATTDAFGKQIAYVHDIANRKETVTDRLGNSTVNEYDADGNVIKVTDPLGNSTVRTYDGHGNTLSETNALGKARSYTYDQNDNRLTEVDSLGKTTTYTYTALNRVATIKDALGRLTTNTYDNNGNLKQVLDATGGTTIYTYDANGNQTSGTDAANAQTSYTYNNLGRLTQQTDALNNSTTYTYDGNGNRKTETRTRTTTSGPETLINKYDYDGNNRLIQTTFPDNTLTKATYNAIGKQATTIDQLGRTTTYTYDDMGRLTKTAFPDGTNEQSTYDAEGRRLTSINRLSRTTSHTYDKLGRLTRTDYPDSAFNQTAYDAIGQVTEVTDARGNKTKYTYDDAGRRTKVTDALNHDTVFAYDDVGNQSSVTDANANKTQYEYDNANRRKKTIYPDATFDSVGYDTVGRSTSKTDQAGKTTQFTYDKLGRLTQVTDALSQITSYTYDEVGNRISQTDANTHTTTFAYDKLGRRTKRTLPLSQSESFTYYDDGSLKTKVDFNGKTTTYQYDQANRLLSKTPDASFNASPISFTYTNSGQRLSMTDPSGITGYTYDSRDRLTKKVTPQGTLTYTYDTAGNLGSMRSSNTNGTSVDYSYDVLNRLSTVKDNRLTSGTTTYTYDTVGNLQGYLYPNGVQSSYVYDTLNRLKALTIAKTSTTLASYNYMLGAAGNRTQVTELGGRQVAYGYDALYRLTAETITGSSVNGVIGYVYDPVGNRKMRTSTVAPVPAATYSYDNNDRLTTDTYDADGNTTASGTATYTYEFENRLIAQGGPTPVTIIYDGDGNRVSKTVGAVTTKYLVDERNLTGYSQVMEETSNGSIQRVYTYGLNRISQSQTSVNSFYGYDGHGSVRLLTDTIGAGTDRYDFDAFGNIISQTGSTPNVYLYSGEQNDPNLGFYYLRARYLNAGSGRFISADQFLGVADDPRSLHLYTYALNDPVSRVDPSGNISYAELSTTVTILSIVSKISFDVSFLALNALPIIVNLYEPAFAARNGALQIISDTTRQEEIEWAIDIYQKANFLIQVASVELRAAYQINRASKALIDLGLAISKSALALNVFQTVATEIRIGTSTTDFKVKGTTAFLTINELSDTLAMHPRTVPKPQIDRTTAIFLEFFKLGADLISKLK